MKLNVSVRTVGRISIIIFCLEIAFRQNSYHTETSQLIWKANQLTGFYRTRIFTERYFRILCLTNTVRGVYLTDTGRCFDVYKTSTRRPTLHRHLTDVETTPCVYGVDLVNIYNGARTPSYMFRGTSFTSDCVTNSQ